MTVQQVLAGDQMGVADVTAGTALEVAPLAICPAHVVALWALGTGVTRWQAVQ